ncbi:hypothetical protein GCM10027516_12970 [Niabella aquatica]
MATGRNYKGSLGNGTPSDNALYGLQEIVPGTQWRSVVGTFSYTIAIQSNGTLWTWGDNLFGQLGNGSTTGSTIPVQVGTDTDWKSIAVGYNHSLALKENGTLWAWGQGGDGQLGNSSASSSNRPVQVGTDTDWESITGCGYSSMALKKNGTLWAWGSNQYGQLGNGTTSRSNRPVQVGTATDWQSVVGAGSYCIAIKSDGTLWSWGSNEYGQLGLGTTTNSRVPVQVGSATNWRSIAASYNQVLAIQSNGTLWSWGSNEYGQLGLGTTVNSLVPAQVGTATNWTSIATGFGLSLAVNTGGRLMGWGWSADGKLGFKSSIVGNVVKPYPINIYNTGWPGSNASATQDYLVALLPYTFEAGCNPIATVTINTAGNVTATVKVLTGQPKEYLKRYYEITPAVNPATTNGTVKLYFTNEEFKSFNGQVPAPALLLPDMDDAATVAARKANLRIEKRSSDGSSIQTINPGTSGVVYNADAGRWEVTFNVSGFSSFYVKTQTANLVLPVTFGRIAATVQDNELDVSWQTLSESNNDHFIIEASGDGEIFKAIGQTPSLAKGGNADTTLNYRFRFNTHSNGIAAMLGAGLFAGLLSLFKRNRKWATAVAVAGVLSIIACNKAEVKEVNVGNNLFIRITQVDKDGTETQSAVVKAVKH